MRFSGMSNMGSHRGKRTSIAVACVLTVAFLMVGQALAQLDTAIISGTVRDPSGAVVPGATISIKKPRHRSRPHYDYEWQRHLPDGRNSAGRLYD